MTITTAKRASGFRFVRLAPLAAALAAALPAHASWTVTPMLTLTETYSDNPALQADADAHGSWITELVPGIAVRGRSRQVDFDASGRVYKFHYSGGEIPNARESQREYAARMNARVISDTLFLEANAARRSQSILPFGPQASTNRYSELNQTDISTWSVSPMLAHRFGGTALARVRYTHDEAKSERRTGYADSQADTFSADLTSGTNFRRVRWGANFMRQQLDTDGFGESTSQTAHANVAYIATSRLSLTFDGGYDEYDYKGLGGRTAGRSWQTGFHWTPSSRTSLQMGIGRHYFGNTGSLSASHRSRHTVWTLNYTDAVTNTRNQFTLPAAFDTAAMLDRLFSATISDPDQRARAVAAYIEATGLPPTLTDNISYLTNRYIRQKLLRASMVMNWRRSSLVLSAYNGQSNALSSADTDSALLGPQFSSLNDAIRQRGASASANYRVSPRSNLFASATHSYRRSLTTGTESREQAFRIGGSRDFGRSLRTRLELRHLTGEGALSGRREYRENALAATLTAQF